MSLGTIIALVIVAIVVITIVSIVGWYISVRNRFIRMEQDIESSESRIDIYLTKRFDDLTKMNATIKGYTKHESETLSKVVELRNPGKNATMEEKAKFNEAMNTISRQINLVVEQYPNLKADTLFANLQKEISEIEENLQAARSNYNSNVSIYNKSILVFPNNIVAGSRFTKRDFFEAEESKREDVKLEF